MMFPFVAQSASVDLLHCLKLYNLLALWKSCPTLGLGSFSIAKDVQRLHKLPLYVLGACILLCLA